MKTKNSSNKMLPLVGIESLDIWFQVQYYIFWTNLVFACKTETLDSLYTHAHLIISIKSKDQVVCEQKFEDLQNSTCQIRSERIVFDLESEV